MFTYLLSCRRSIRRRRWRSGACCISRCRSSGSLVGCIPPLRGCRGHFDLGSLSLDITHRTLIKEGQGKGTHEKKRSKHSLQEIGDLFGGRDHGTVIHACKAVENMMEQDASVRGSVEFLKTQLSR